MGNTNRGGGGFVKKRAYVWAVALACGTLLVMAGGLLAADEPAKGDGAWQVTVETERGSFDQSLTIQQDGGKIKGTLSGRRGDSPIEGTLEGAKINFTVIRDTPNGAMTINYTGTVDGDSMTGTFKSDRFNGKWTAKKGSAASQK